MRPIRCAATVERVAALSGNTRFVPLCEWTKATHSVITVLHCAMFKLPRSPAALEGHLAAGWRDMLASHLGCSPLPPGPQCACPQGWHEEKRADIMLRRHACFPYWQGMNKSSKSNGSAETTHQCTSNYLHAQCVGCCKAHCLTCSHSCMSRNALPRNSVISSCTAVASDLHRNARRVHTLTLVVALGQRQQRHWQLPPG